MKFSYKTLLTVATILVVVQGQNCNDDEGCIGELGACTSTPDNCCEGFSCHGFNFFKRCMETPFCLEEWWACNPSPALTEEAIQCCDGLVCVTTDTGLGECHKPTTRTVEIPGFNLEQYVETPSEPPLPTKTFVCPTPTIRSAQLTGDPHIRTFDGLTYDCQGIGEHVIFKTDTSRQIQGRFTRVLDKDVSVTHGLAIRDQGGASVPKVQLSIPVSPDPDTDDYTVLGGNSCKLQLFVDGEQHILKPGVSYESDQVTVSLNGSEVTTLYKSGFKVKVTMGYWNGCLLNTYLTVPTCQGDSITGLLGDADGNANNDWISKTGQRLSIPEYSLDRSRKPAYDYCVPNWCIVNKAESIFHYNEVGYDFDYYNQCALAYGMSLAEFIKDLPAAIVDRCQANLGCMIDVLAEDKITAEAAIRTVAIDHFELKEDDPNLCSAKNGDCSGANTCCGGLNCVKFSPTEWQCKEGIMQLTQLKPQCNPFEGGYCDKVKCCGDMQCVENADEKLWLCEKPAAECVPETQACGRDADCCKGMICADPKTGKEGKRKVCLKLPMLSDIKGICFPEQPCKPGLLCEDGHCQEDKPVEWGKDCGDEKKCIDGLACIPFKNRKVCADPGIQTAANGKKELKIGAICTIGDEKFKCADGCTCQKPKEKNYAELVKKLGETEAMKIG